MRAETRLHRVDATGVVHRDAAGFAFRPLCIPDDIPTLHRWFTAERGAFWLMRDKTEDEVRQTYRALMDSGHATAYVGIHVGIHVGPKAGPPASRPAFLAECYDPAYDRLHAFYPVRPGDLGMHVFIGPPEVRIPGFTRAVFGALMRFMFAHLGAQRIVVEPDARNHRIHALNRSVGFVDAREIVLPEKTARLAFCTRRDFDRATATPQETNPQEAAPP